MAQLDKSPFSYSATSSNLGEIDIIVPDTSMYTVKCTLTLPSIVQGNGQSAVVTVVKVNSTTKYTSNAGDFGVDCEVACSAGDTIKIITSSSNANDNAINAVRIQIAISEGGSL